MDDNNSPQPARKIAMTVFTPSLDVHSLEPRVQRLQVARAEGWEADSKETARNCRETVKSMARGCQAAPHRLWFSDVKICKGRVLRRVP